MTAWRRLFDTIDDKQTQPFLQFLTDDAVFRYGSNPPAVGRAAIATVVDQVFASIRSCSHRLLEVWEPPGAAIVRGEVTYVRLDGRSVVLPFCNVLELRDGKIARYEIYIDPAPLAAP